MYNAEYSPVIGWKDRTLVWSQSKYPRLWDFTSQSQGCILCCIIKTTEFRQTTV